METRLDHPEMLGGFEAANLRRVRSWAVRGLGLWLLLVAGDWTARLGMFRWQDQWLPQQAKSLAFGAAQVRTVPAQTGAGLTQMVPVPWIAARYAEFHPERMEHRDEWGYFNDSSPGPGGYPVVMLGDSFMVSLGTQNLAQVLAAVGDIPVYNHARPASGPFLEMRQFLAADRFQPPPKIVVWNLTARELGGALFQRQRVEGWFERSLEVESNFAGRRSRILWDHLAPSALRKSWPDTSLLAYGSRRVWSQSKLLVFREWPRDVLGAEDPQFGPMLFYRENLRVLPLLTPETDAPAVVQTVARVSTRFRDRGQTLVVLLVPEKEQVHLRALPPADQKALARGPELLASIELGLKAAGIPVVNLLPTFQEALAQGHRLYWRDDTHWNDAGIGLAAKELWRTVEPLLEGNQETISNIQHSISNDQVSDR